MVIVTLAAASLTHSHQVPSTAERGAIKQFDVGAFLEGVVFDADGYGYVSDYFGGAIYRFQPGGSPVLWAKSSRPNGHKILADGTHIVADAGERAIVRFDDEGQRQDPTIRMSDGVGLHSPNDITLDAKGGYYFTDMRDSYSNAPTGTVHHVDANGNVRTVASGLSAPNGLVLSPDARTLYVSESRSNHVLAFAVTDSGALKDKLVLADLSGEGDFSQSQVLDGITVDNSGTLYVAFHRLGRVYALSPSGEIAQRFDAGMLSVANVAFAPKSHGLFVVGSSDFERTKGTVYMLELPGVGGVSR